VAVVFKNLPLPMHANAMGAALAMQAANRQGKAWQMHDKMFENREALTRPDLERYAAGVGLDVEKFKADIDDPSVKQEVEADMKAATDAGVRGTPAFFVNGTQMRGLKPPDEFGELLDQELAKADELMKQGVALADVYEKRSKVK